MVLRFEPPGVLEDLLPWLLVRNRISHAVCVEGEDPLRAATALAAALTLIIRKKSMNIVRLNTRENRASPSDSLFFTLRA